MTPSIPSRCPDKLLNTGIPPPPDAITIVPRLTNVLIDSTLVENEQLSSVLSTADIFLVPMKDNYFLNLSLPTKILEYQALGRPIICLSDGAPGNYVQNTNSGLKISSNNLSELLSAIENLRSDNNLLKTLGENGIRYVNDNLTFTKITQRLSTLIEN